MRHLEIVLTSDERQAGVVVGHRPCTLEGCGGQRFITRWGDGRRTEPCARGLETICTNATTAQGGELRVSVHRIPFHPPTLPPSRPALLSAVDDENERPDELEPARTMRDEG